MIFFAHLENNIVKRIVEIDDRTAQVFKNEEEGKAYCIKKYGEGTWVQAYLTMDGKRGLTGVDFYYDESTDRFLPPKPSKSFTFNYNTNEWEAPIPKPINPGVEYKWDEYKLKWVPDMPVSTPLFTTSLSPVTAAQPVKTIIR